jgi:hypothetical protein
MKASNVIAAFLSILLLNFTSCEEIESLNLTDVSAPVEADFIVLTTDSLIEKTETIDAGTNDDFVKNRSKIDEISIERLSYQVVSMSPVTADSLIEGKFEFWNPVSNTFELLSSANNKKLRLNVSQDLPFDPIVATKMVGQFKSSDPKATIRFKASANKRGTDLTVRVKIYLKLKVKI